MREVRMKARAKINISLDVVRKREDGYHDLSMIMQTVDVFDKVNIKRIKKDEILLKTNLPFLPVDDKNLVVQVIKYMKSEFNIKEGVFVDLYKVIPIGAGLAGGSADAAVTIKGMNKLFNLKLSLKDMMEIGKNFGADIPYCINEGTALAEGIGEKITYLKDFPKCHIVICKPTFSISTGSIFRDLDISMIKEKPNTSLLIDSINNGDIHTIAKNLCNVLETVTIKKYPQIKDIKDEMINQGALGSLMSGSGSAVFGIFDNKDLAAKAAKQLKSNEIIKFVYLTKIYNRKRVFKNG